MANDNQNQVLDEQTEVIDDQKAPAKRVRKTKPKSTE
nr:RNA polymerase-binding protein DksA [Acinetobacter sp.]